MAGGSSSRTARGFRNFGEYGSAYFSTMTEIHNDLQT